MPEVTSAVIAAVVAGRVAIIFGRARETADTWRVTTKEAYYTRVVKRDRFGGEMYCRACQQRVAPS
jgi:hypothetical protein